MAGNPIAFFFFFFFFFFSGLLVLRPRDGGGRRGARGPPGNKLYVGFKGSRIRCGAIGSLASHRTGGAATGDQIAGVPLFYDYRIL